MNKLFSEVQVLIWDFDATLFPPNEQLHHAMREAEYAVIMEQKKISRDEAAAEFEKYYKKVSPSGTKTVAYICNIPTTQAAQGMEAHFDRRSFLKRDEKLVAEFQKLQNFKHYILANGIAHSLEAALSVIGVPAATFTEIVTSEISGENKPSDVGFKYILSKTGLPPAAHMMIGDRDAVDLAPAKALGMHTCLVWSSTPSAVADITLPTVYEVASALQ